MNVDDRLSPRAVKGQDEVIDQTLDADLRGRLESLDTKTRRTIYSPPQILLTMKAALLHSPQLPDDDDNQLSHQAWVELLLMATDLRDDAESSVNAASRDAHEELRDLLSLSVRATLDHQTEPYVYALGRASIMFTRLPSHNDLKQAADFIDLDQRFRMLTGISIDDYFAIGLRLVTWFRSSVIEPDLRYRRWVELETFFSSCALDRLVVRRTLDSLTLTRETAKLACGEREAEDPLFANDFVPFMQRPLFRTNDSRLIPISLHFLESRVTNGVYWILFDSMNDGDRRRLARFYGQILEAYVRETIHRMLPSGKGIVDRVFSEFTYMTSTGERKTSDIVALYPGAAIFFEVTSARWRLDSTRLASSAEALEEDFDRIILKKARQLDARIADFRRGQYQFDEVCADQVRMIIPVVVTSESVPLWTATHAATQSALRADRLLDAPVC